MKIGQKDQKRKLVHDKEEFIDPSFFHIQFSIGGKVFKKAVDGLLSFEVENLDDLTDEDLDKALDQCSYYRFTFLAAAAELETAIAKKQREYDAWRADASQQARRMLIEERQALKVQEKVPNNWIGSVTKEEIHGKLLTNKLFSEQMTQFETTIDNMTKQKTICNGLRDILNERGRHLQSLGKRRLENRRMSFGVKDYGSH